MYYKVLNDDGSCYNGGTGRWSLPTRNDDGTWAPGKWMPPIDRDLVACENGYHGCTETQLVEWLGPAIFEMEYRDEPEDHGNKMVGRQARLLRRLDTWNERTMRLFACDCAEHVVHLCGDDPRPRNAITTARRYANGEATAEELAAARVAAWDAAMAAARDAARAAARAAAWAAARVAAWVAARAAAKAAAWDAEREWQAARLMEVLYDDS